MWENNLFFSTNELQEKKKGRGNLYSKRFERHINANAMLLLFYSDLNKLTLKTL